MKKENECLSYQEEIDYLYHDIEKIIDILEKHDKKFKEIEFFIKLLFLCIIILFIIVIVK